MKQKLEELMLDALYNNKSDEADDGSWIESKDYHKAAQACADIAKAEAVGFAEWMDYNAVRCGPHEFTCRLDSHKKRYTTEQLYLQYQTYKATNP